MKLQIVYITVVVLALSLLSFAQVPSSDTGSIALAEPVPEGSGIGWNFSLSTLDETSPNRYSYDLGKFSLTTQFPIAFPQLLVTLTGIPKGRKIVDADDIGCYYVRFHISQPLLVVSKLDGSNPKSSTPRSVDYFQEFCSLGGGSEDFWSAGGVTAVN